jgi:hypothetical protein
MKFSWQLVVQVIASICQVLNFASGVVPVKYQPIVLFVLTVLQAVTGLISHYYNPDGTRATTAYVAKVLLLCLLVSGLAMAQAPVTPAPAPVTGPIAQMFTTGSSVTNLHLGGQNNPGSDIFGQFLIKQNGSTNFIARTDTLLVPGINFQGYYGGVEVDASLDKILAKTTLPKNAFQAYAIVEGGFARNVPATGPVVQKPSFRAFGGIKYDPLSNKNFTVNLIEGGYLYASGGQFGCVPPTPCTPHSNGWTLSVGISLSPWTK